MNESLSVDLIPEEDILDLVCDRADTGEWFVIPAFSSMGQQLLTQIEQVFFMNGNNDKFHLLMGSFSDIGFGAFALAKKSEICPKIFKEKFGGEFIDQRDFMLTPDFPKPVWDIIHQKLLQRERENK